MSAAHAPARRYAVILGGGLGTRFWPQSRRRFPKQFLAMRGRRSLLQDTVRRLKGVVPPRQVVVVAPRELTRQIRAQLPELPREQLLVEPDARGTAPCLALAAARIEQRDPSALMAVFPADHAITDLPKFRRAVLTGFAVAARERCLVTFGIAPTGPEIGYGYIEVGAPLGQGAVRLHWAARFHEKPDRATAQAYVDAGRYVWNSGMFVWRVDVLRQAFERYSPATARMMRAVGADDGSLQSRVALRRAYRCLAAASIDVEIMERAERVAVVRGDFGWNDVGTWAAMAPLWGADAAGNTRRGKTVVIDCQDTVVCGCDRLVAVLGVDDLVVVDSPDAVLVCPKSRAQDVRRIVAVLADSRYRGLL